MDQFNYENVSQFLKDLKAQEKPESARQVITRLAPEIRELTETGYTLKEVYDLLVERFGLQITFSAFRNYLYRKSNKEPGQ